jgi:hypothetical protein
MNNAQMLSRPIAAVMLAAALLACAACSGKPPQISRVFARPILVHDIDAGTYSTRMSVFVMGSDADGADDIATLFVVNDDAELFWSVDSKSWISQTADGETWIGTNGVVMAGGGPFPAGTYRVILEDQGGETAEDTFALGEQTADPSKGSYPQVAVKDGTVRVTGTLPNPELWVYSKDGRLTVRLSAAGQVAGAAAGVQTATGTPITLDAIAASNAALGPGFTFWAYANNERGGFGLLVGPYSSAGLQGR